MSILSCSYLLAIQPGGSQRRLVGFTQWLVEFLIHPDYQAHRAAPQMALKVFYWTLFALLIGGVLALVHKMWWEKSVVAAGMSEISHGPRRSLWVLLSWLFLLILIYLVVDIWAFDSFYALMQLGNVIKVTGIGALGFVLWFLVLLAVAGYKRHMPWRRVK